MLEDLYFAYDAKGKFPCHPLDLVKLNPFEFVPPSLILKNDANPLLQTIPIYNAIIYYSVQYDSL